MFIVILKTSNWGNSYNHKDIASVVYTFQIVGTYKGLSTIVVYTFQISGIYNKNAGRIFFGGVVYTFQIVGTYNLTNNLDSFLGVVYTFQIGGIH
jgi:hypothetical protein